MLRLKRSWYPNLDSILKSRDITLPTKVRIVKATLYWLIYIQRETKQVWPNGSKWHIQVKVIWMFTELFWKLFCRFWICKNKKLEIEKESKWSESNAIKNDPQNCQYDPAIPLPGIHIEETRSERDTCTPMFITALFIIARTWKQLRCPSAGEWIKKVMVHIHNGILLSH